MNCPKCNTINREGNSFCVNCGESLVNSTNLSPTLIATSLKSETERPTEEIPFTGFQPPNSQPTVFGGHQNYSQQQTANQPSQANFQSFPGNFQPSQPNSQSSFFQPSNVGFNQFQPLTPFVPTPQVQKRRFGLWLGLGVFVLILLIGGTVAAILLLNKTIVGQKEALPEHFGLFFQNSDKTQLNELKKQEFGNALTGKDVLLKDDSMPSIEPKPTFVLYFDDKDVPFKNLKLVQVDSMKNDGAMTEIEFKAAPVEAKPDMKKIWLEENIANGKYAFVLFEGFLDDGKHKFWAFQVKNSDKSDNGSLAKSSNVGLKNTNSDSKKDQKTSETVSNTKVASNTVVEKKVPPPVGSSTVYVRSNNVVLRAGPSQLSPKIGGLYRGQKVYVLEYSDLYETFVTKDGRELYSNYAYIQTESGKRGWVYAAYIR